jgi:hypothetical protein
MLSVLTKTFRAKAATVLAALYVLCILAPAVAFALSDNPAIAHCLTEGHVGVHDHAAKHEHGGKLHVCQTLPAECPLLRQKEKCRVGGSSLRSATL